jgi:hypothetical protein
MCFASARIVAADARRQTVSFDDGGGAGVLALVDVGSLAAADALRPDSTSSALPSSSSGSSASSGSSGSLGAQATATSVAVVASAPGAQPVEGSAWTTVTADRSATAAMAAMASVFTSVPPRGRKLLETQLEEEHARLIRRAAMLDQAFRDDVG